MTLVTLPELQIFAENLSKEVCKGTPILLYGDLGAGKTTFSKFFIKSFLNNPDIDITSPTFTLVNVYDVPNTGYLWHCDLYRLHSPEEVLELGLMEAMNQHITLIEWPERLGPYLPSTSIRVHLNIIDDLTRQLFVERF